jgi:hypothetical protein
LFSGASSKDRTGGTVDKKRDHVRAASPPASLDKKRDHVRAASPPASLDFRRRETKSKQVQIVSFIHFRHWRE